MKKKFMAVALTAAMTATLFAGCGDAEETQNEATKAPEQGNTTETPAATEAPVKEEVKPEELPAAFAHITFDGADEGYTALAQTSELGDLTGANFGLAAAPDAVFRYADGPVDKALFIDGSFGLDLGLQPTNTDAYTVSFWVNADRLATFGPTLQFGNNIGMADGNNVSWMNVTQSEWGADGAKIFPIVWSRNEQFNFVADDGTVTNCWPWMYSFDNEIHGKREWAMVTIVVTGEEQTPASGIKTAGAKFYVNGELKYDSQENYTNGTYFEYTWDATIAPGLMKPANKFESLFGINYWDTVFKGYVDDLYVFDTAITDGQVAKLFSLGNKDVESKVDMTDVAPEPEVKPVEINITGTAIGTTDCETGWWGAFSDTWKLEAGESMTKTFINYHNVEASNWNNFIVVLQNVAEQAEDNGYKEYGIVRADNYGFCGANNTIDNADVLGWTVESDWDWATFLDDMQGATVKVTVTNNTTYVDVDCEITTAAGATHFQKYGNIAVDGDVYFRLGIEKACLDLLD